ncbi:MAG TPA: dihydroorotate dehydrogenase electron transfer subunit, partial [Spirochaetota bacterium]|nr:dihydroorotate dehydrogenase electron transfer subunit [Spirochaetota bacterium]
KNNKQVIALFGGRSFQHIEYLTELFSENLKIKFYTDDGSYGEKGFVIKDLDRILNENRFDSCYICGPEKMMAITIDKLKDKVNNVEISMERYMKCGLGLCGSCAIDDIGLRVCEDGPVFSYKETISLTKEFANYHRDGLGIIIR